MGTKNDYNQTTAEIIENSIKIAEEYAKEGLTLTLRQLYYQHVSRGLEANGQHVYKRIGSTLTEARFTGEFPIEHLEDRGRNTGEADWSDNDDDVDHALSEAERAIKALPRWYLKRSRWWGQPNIVSVWVEKEALAGVFEDTCKELGVSLFPCKGYPSVSSLWAWHRDMADTRANAAELLGMEPTPIILYFGDHDPDGWEIPRSAERSLRRLQGIRGEHFDFEFRRLALLKKQIDQYKPPPFPAKETSARYASYVKEHKIKDAWELDALEPRVLRKLIADGVNGLFDESIHKQNEREIRSLRADLRTRMREQEFIDAALGE